MFGIEPQIFRKAFHCKTSFENLILILLQSSESNLLRKGFFKLLESLTLEVQMIIELSVIPIGVGTSLSKYVACVMRVIKESGLKYESHSMATNIECDWDDIMPLVKKCHDELKKMGVERISTSIRISERTDKPYTMEGKIVSLEEKL